MLEDVRDALRTLKPAAATEGEVAEPEDLAKVDHLNARIQMVRAL